MKVVALVPAAGRGERLGAHVPKALVPVAGTPLVTRATRGLLDSGVVDAVVVAAPADHLGDFESCLAEFGHRCSVVAGGADRTSSVRAALESVASGAFDAVLVHDAARAFTPPTVPCAVIEALSGGAQAVVPVLPLADTVKQVDADGVVTGTPDRSSLRAVQTPQGFAEPLLRRVHASAPGSATDDASLVERVGIPVATVMGHPHAMKITTPFDLQIAEKILVEQP